MLTTEPLVDSTDLAGDVEALRSRADEDGYLFFKGLLDPAKILEVRRQMVEVLVAHGLVDARLGPGRERILHEAVAAQPKDRVIEQCMTVELYTDLQRLEALHALPHDAGLLRLFGDLFGEAVLVHPRNIARVIMPPERFFPTPPHQDYPLIQGASDTWTCWITLGDAPLAMGPLALMPGSHRHGVLDTVVMPGAGATGVKIANLPARWASTDFEAGDALMFHCLTVHRALPQERRDIVRLSMDARYQPASQQIQPMSLRPHLATYDRMAFGNLSEGCDWADVYRGWKHDDLKYYWRRHSLALCEFEAELVPFMRELDPERRARLRARLDDRDGL